MQLENILSFIYVIWKYRHWNFKKNEVLFNTKSFKCSIRSKQLNIPSQYEDSHLFKHMESFGFWTK